MLKEWRSRRGYSQLGLAMSLSRGRPLLGVLYAALGAFTFALNNATMRRGVVTGSVLQGMALTVPIGGEDADALLNSVRYYTLLRLHELVPARSYEALCLSIAADIGDKVLSKEYTERND
jgi:hypothetical protein